MDSQGGGWKGHVLNECCPGQGEYSISGHCHLHLATCFFFCSKLLKVLLALLTNWFLWARLIKIMLCLDLSRRNDSNEKRRQRIIWSSLCQVFWSDSMSYPRQLSVHHSPPSSCNFRSTEVVRRFPTTTFALPLPSPDCWKVDGKAERLKGLELWDPLSSVRIWTDLRKFQGSRGLMHCKKKNKLKNLCGKFMMPNFSFCCHCETLK